MPITTSCPSCSRALRVPDDLLGKNVKCPTCGTTFLAAGESAPPPAEEEPPAPAPARRPAPPDDYDDGPAAEERRPARRRSSLQPHRGQIILILGILALVTGTGWILGPIAWIMGNNDLKEIRAGRMDPEGEGTTNAGRICGMIATIFNIAVVACGCVGFAIIMIAGIAGGAHH
jgi:predicted Zn finger-like uncharacterized protein